MAFAVYHCQDFGSRQPRQIGTAAASIEQAHPGFN